MSSFPLNDDWTVEYFHPDVDGFEMAPSVQPVPRLPDWTCEARFAEAGFYAWLQRRFELQATDFCVRYEVQIEGIPGESRVFVNDQFVLQTTKSTERVDITDFVSLGVNRLSLRLHCAPASFEAVVLIQAACEER